MLGKHSSNIATPPTNSKTFLTPANVFPRIKSTQQCTSAQEKLEERGNQLPSREGRCNPRPQKGQRQSLGKQGHCQVPAHSPERPCCGMQLILSTATPEQSGRPAKFQECGPGREVPAFPWRLASAGHWAAAYDETRDHSEHGTKEA